MRDSPESQARILARDARSLTLCPEAAEGIVSGTPTTGTCTLGELGGIEVGIWEITAGTVRDTEADEIFVVLSGAGRVDFEDGEVLHLSPGMAVRLYTGERTTWTITETLRKIWVA